MKKSSFRFPFHICLNCRQLGIIGRYDYSGPISLSPCGKQRNYGTGGEVCPSPSRSPRSPVGDRIAAGPHLPVTVTSNSPYNFTRNKPDKSGTIYLQITLHTPHTHTDTKKCTACVRYTIFPLFPVEN